MADCKEKLFSEFPPISTEEWMEKITVDLKGADFEKKLVWRTNEGFKVQPFYREEDLQGLDTDSKPGEFPYVRGTKACNEWKVRQTVIIKDVKEANAKVLDILSKGVDSIHFFVGKDVLDEKALEVLLNGVSAECVELNFGTAPWVAAQQAKALVAYFTAKNYDLTKLQGSVFFDPMGTMLEMGADLAGGLSKAKEVMEALAPLKKYRCLGASPMTLADAGAYCYQELGYALAWGNEYMRTLTEAGMPAEDVAKKIYFGFSISSNYFMEIAKFRAARMLWAKIVEAYQPACHCNDKPEDGICRCACKMKIHAHTSRYNQTVFDPYINLLRGQTEAMSAAIAGVDSLSVTPFDSAYENPTEFAERISRNQQLLLKEESHFDKVVDPAGGSYYIENLTAAIAEQAWKLFLSVEEEGGLLKMIQEGKLQEAVNATNKARHEAAAKRREGLLGTNQFPNINETAGERKPKQLYSMGANAQVERNIAMLDNQRLANEFETLRLATEASGKRPKVFMLTIGNLAMRQARAQFSGNFFGCAGYQIIDNLGFKTVEEGAEAAAKAGADIVVLCSSDDEYAEYGPAAFKAVGDKAIFVIAGAPACMEDLKAQGIENYVHVRCNVLETLKDFNRKLNIK